MDSEDSQLGNLSSNLEENETDSPPPAKVRRGTGSTSFEARAFTSRDYVTDSFAVLQDYNSNLEQNQDGPNRDLDFPSNNDRSVTGDQRSDNEPENSSDVAQSPEESTQGQVAPVQVTNNDAENEERGDGALQTERTRFYEAGNYIIEKEDVSSLNTDLGILNEVYELLAKNETKTKCMLLLEYLGCPIRFRKVKDLLSTLQNVCQDIKEFLETSGEDRINSVGSGHLKTEIEKADRCGLIQLLTHVVTSMENRQESIENTSNNVNVVSDVVCGTSSSQTPVVSDNVQAADIVNEVRMEEDPGTDEPIEISIEFMPVASSSSHPPNVESATTWMESITNMLFNNLYLDTREALLTRKEKISRMGKRLFTTLFSKQEILSCFARAKKNIPAYDRIRVFEISQIINFMLTQNHHNENFLEEFRCDQYKNNGLGRDDYLLFWENIMIKFASDERRKIKTGQS